MGWGGRGLKMPAVFVALYFLLGGEGVQCDTGRCVKTDRSL